MPWTRKQVRKLLSSGSPLTSREKSKMKAELHANPSLGYKRKGDVESHSYNFRNHRGGRRSGQ